MKTTHLLIIMLTSVVLFSCKKYDDGPVLSLRTKKSRIANEWQFDQVVAPNGTNITTQFANSGFELSKDGEYIITEGISAETGQWRFASDKENLVLTPNDNSSATLLMIMRLKEKDFWFSIEETDGIYEYRMSPK